MKKILLLISISALCLSGCDLDINEDPNYPSNESVTADLVFPAIENAIATANGDAMFNYASFYAQYFEQKPEKNQYNDIVEQNLQESSALIDRSYRTLYAGALQDIEDVKSKTTNAADLFAATVLRAYAFQLLVDNMSECPYTEALQGSAIPSPAWDNGETVYKGVLAEMDAAEAALGSSDNMECTDPLLNKDVDAWRGFANALRLRMYMRLIDGGIDAATYTSAATALVQSDDFFSGNVAFDVYSDLEGQYNPWYGAVFALTDNHCAAHPLISYLSATNDPRIAYGFSPAEATSTYVGQMPGAKTVMKNWGSNTDWKDVNVSAVKYAPAHAMPVYFFTQSELQFLIAEVQLRFLSNSTAAKSAYEAGVAADFSARGMGGQETAFLAGALVNWDAAGSTDAQLKLIYMQKWVAFYYMNPMEGWSELRRTDCPALSSHSGKEIYEDPSIYEAGNLIEPAINGLEAGGLVKRTYYPSSARQLNPNTPAAVSPATPVFWDK